MRIQASPFSQNTSKWYETFIRVLLLFINSDSFFLCYNFPEFILIFLNLIV